MAIDLKARIRTIPDYPKKGILFRDITTLLGDAQAFRTVINEMVNRHTGADIDKVVAIESRGFILGAAIAHQLGVGFVPVRKKGKLPGTVIAQDYDLEYGTDTLEIHIDALAENDQCLVVDDLIATGGTAFATIALVEKLKAKVAEVCFVIDLPDLGGADKLRMAGHKVHALLEFPGH